MESIREMSTHMCMYTHAHRHKCACVHIHACRHVWRCAQVDPHTEKREGTQQTGGEGLDLQERGTWAEGQRNEWR